MTLLLKEAPLLLERLFLLRDCSYWDEIVSKTPPLKSPKLRLLSIVVSWEKVVVTMPSSNTPVRMEMTPRVVMTENGLMKAPTTVAKVGVAEFTAAKSCPKLRKNGPATATNWPNV